MDISPATLETLLSVDNTLWRKEVTEVHKFIDSFGAAAPQSVRDHVSSLEGRLDIGHNTPATTNKKLLQWVAKWAAVFQPDDIWWVDGTEEEYNTLCGLLVKNGTFTKLNDKLRPNSYLARSTTDDVARVEERTYICTPTKEEAGPTNNWVAPDEMKKTITGMGSLDEPF